MTREELENGLLRWGGDVSRWPLEHARAARILVERDAAAARFLSDFVATESELAEALVPPPFGAPEVGHVLAALDAEGEDWRPGRWFWIGSAAASAAAFSSGAAAVLLLFPSTAGLDVLLPILGIAAGQGSIGGLM
jgi:hypothetical protein